MWHEDESDAEVCDAPFDRERTGAASRSQYLVAVDFGNGGGTAAAVRRSSGHSQEYCFAATELIRRGIAASRLEIHSVFSEKI